MELSGSPIRTVSNQSKSRHLLNAFQTATSKASSRNPNCLAKFTALIRKPKTFASSATTFQNATESLFQKITRLVISQTLNLSLSRMVKVCLPRQRAAGCMYSSFDNWNTADKRQICIRRDTLQERPNSTSLSREQEDFCLHRLRRSRWYQVRCEWKRLCRLL